MENRKSADQHASAIKGDSPIFDDQRFASVPAKIGTVPAHPALALLVARPERFARQGSVVASWRRRGTHTYGPYYRLIYREEGRQRSIYLGRAGGLVEAIRGRLLTLQAPLRAHRAAERTRRHAAALMRASKAQLNLCLRPWGLRLQGFEVRGWRTSPIWAAVGKQVRHFTNFGRFAARLPRLPSLALPRLPSLALPRLASLALPRLPSLALRLRP
jgi:hypothetical protein